MWWKSSVIGVVAFVSGVAVAIFLAAKLEERMWEEFRIYTNSFSVDAEMKVTTYTHILLGIQEQRPDNAMRLACMRLKNALPYVRDDLFQEPERNQTARDRIENARKLVADLESQNLCGLPLQE